MTDTQPDIRTGGCACGKVRYRASGAPKWTAHCHCSDCRRQTSAAFATWISYPADAVSWEGEPRLYASSQGVARGFCPDCGTPLAYRGPQWEGEMHLLVGSLDAPGEVTPSVHAYLIDALPWIHVADGLPRFERTRREGPPLP